MKCENPRKLRDGRVVPCGKCMACRASYSDEWIARFMCEAEAFKRGAFFGTLTYNEQELPAGRNLKIKDVQDYFKRVKKRLKAYDIGMRYSYCGEYGTTRNRPHYHFIVCGVCEKSPSKDDIVRIRKILSDCWTEHHAGSFAYLSEIRSAEASIRYLINYTNKTQGEYALHIGETKKEFEKRTGRVAPFVRYSNGISSAYVEKNLDKIDELDYLEFGGHKFVVPRYFRKKAELARTPSQCVAVLKKIKEHINKTADELWKKDKPLGYVIDRKRLDCIDLEELSLYLTRYRSFCDKRTKIRAKYYQMWRKDYESGRVVPFDNWTVIDCIGCKVTVNLHDAIDTVDKYIAMKKETDFEYLREISGAMKENFFPVGWKETLDAWNEFLMRVYAYFEPLYKQRGRNKATKLRLAMEKRYEKSKKTCPLHD